MKFIEFEPNQPQSFIFPAVGPHKLPAESGSLYPLPDGAWLYLTASLAQSLALLKLSPGEEFAVCMYLRGNTLPEWQVWLAISTEKARAAVEVRELDLEAQLGASLKLVAGSRRHSPAEAAAVPYLAPTGTEGAAIPLPAPKGPALAAVAGGGKRGTRPGPIPYNVAFREIVQLVASELKEVGEQWSDQSRQDAVSTLFIAAGKAGWLGVWERGEDAA